MIYSRVASLQLLQLKDLFTDEMTSAFVCRLLNSHLSQAWFVPRPMLISAILAEFINKFVNLL